MDKSNNLRITFVDSRRIYMRQNDLNGITCSRKRLRLMRQHHLDDLFRIDQEHSLKEVFGPVGKIAVYVPVFTHPHDRWMNTNTDCTEKVFTGRVLVVGKDKEAINNQRGNLIKEQHLLVELAPNVLAFAHCVGECFKKGDKVSFTPYTYNRKTKKIYGYIA